MVWIWNEVIELVVHWGGISQTYLIILTLFPSSKIPFP